MMSIIIKKYAFSTFDGQKVLKFTISMKKKKTLAEKNNNYNFI